MNSEGNTQIQLGMGQMLYVLNVLCVVVSLSPACAQCGCGLFCGFSGLILCMTLASMAGKQLRSREDSRLSGHFCPRWYPHKDPTTAEGRGAHEIHMHQQEVANGLAETRGTRTDTNSRTCAG